jgi:hypothetical protein
MLVRLLNQRLRVLNLIFFLTLARPHQVTMVGILRWFNHNEGSETKPYLGQCNKTLFRAVQQNPIEGSATKPY